MIVLGIIYTLIYIILHNLATSTAGQVDQEDDKKVVDGSKNVTGNVQSLGMKLSLLSSRFRLGVSKLTRQKRLNEAHVFVAAFGSNEHALRKETA